MSCKSFDYAAHGAVTKQLTDRKIGEYMLRGAYGPDKQQQILAEIQSGTCKTFDARIRKGEFTHLAKRALNARVTRPRRKKEKKNNPSISSLIESLGLSDLVRQDHV